MLDFEREVPEWAVVSEYYQERAEGYIKILHMGMPYFIPLTKEMKKALGISRRGDELIFKTIQAELNAEKFLRDIVGGLVNQVQGTIGAQVQRTLSDKLTHFLEDKLEPAFDAMVTGEMNRHLLPEGQRENTTPEDSPCVE